MTTTPDQGTTDTSLAMHTDWFTSGWPHVLPQHQSMMLCMLFGTATVRGLKGTAEQVAHQLTGAGLTGLMHRLGDDWDSPVLWLEPDELDEAETEAEREELQAGARQRQETCEKALQDAGLPMPTTIRELADTMVKLGIATTSDGAWDMPDPLPRPEDVLTLPDSLLVRFRELRRLMAVQPAEQAILGHLIDDLDYPTEVFTSLDRLAEATDQEVDAVRTALAHLVEIGDVRIFRGDPRKMVEADDLSPHTRFYIIPDWDHFNENRIQILRAQDQD